MWAFKKLCRGEEQKMGTGPVGKFFRTRHELVSLRHTFSTEEPLPQGGQKLVLGRRRSQPLQWLVDLQRATIYITDVLWISLLRLHGSKGANGMGSYKSSLGGVHENRLRNTGLQKGSE